MLRQTRFCVPQERSTRSCLPHHRQPVRQERQNTGDRFRSLTHSLLTVIAGSFSLSLSLSSPDSTKEKKKLSSSTRINRSNEFVQIGKTNGMYECSMFFFSDCLRAPCVYFSRFECLSLLCSISTKACLFIVLPLSLSYPPFLPGARLQVVNCIIALFSHPPFPW